ncbi:hypothetical protein [Paraburkholderia sp. UCT2]|uniref:hypothetical protein n=1 Tax=Paraburkholderia sp. UCT2 TaxID=2615208 RepID=UPI00165543BF|nr:hypothetical protein [Paraburkholderia sp. UCT2]MBC8729990.1 hypothetical protein [Paraburkholderia sp. UCT2]
MTQPRNTQAKQQAQSTTASDGGAEAANGIDAAAPKRTLIAKCRIKVDGEYVLTNKEFEIDEQTAKALVSRGRAIDPDHVPRGARAVEPKTGPTIKKTASKPAAAGAGDDHVDGSED